MNIGKQIFKYIKILILVFIIIGTVFAGALAKSIISVIQETPQVDFSGIGESLGESSTIVDINGELIEKLQSSDYKEIKSIDEIPQHVKDAFVAVEDERFYKHSGIDIIGIGRSFIDNILAGGIVRGGSTITQQLARDLYLNDEKTLDRKIKEAYIALKMNEALTKDEILEIYLNRIFLGQNSYGIQSASQTYFSKDVSELTIGEAAALASLPQAPSEYALYNTLPPESIDDSSLIIEEVDINDEKYFAVYNSAYKKRQEYILDKMLELEMIDAQQYSDAYVEDIHAALNPPVRQNDNKNNFFTGIVKSQVIDELMFKYNLDEEEATEMLYNGGLVITSTIDSKMQEDLNNEFENFVDMVVQGTDEQYKDARFLNLSTDEDNNIVNSENEVIYYAKENLFDYENDLFIPQDMYSKDENGLHIKSNALTYSEGSIKVSPFYTVSEGNLRTHSATNIKIPSDELDLSNESEIIISNAYLNSNPDFYLENEAGIFIKSNAYKIDDKGIIQPQSSVVVIDHNKGHIKAIIGGRETSRGLNRAYQIARQPGSTMKPIAVYGPALDNGMTLASPLDDLPRKEGEDRLWPINWYGEYRGITTLRRSLETSSNVNAVNCLEMIGIEKSKEYLEKFHLINKDNLENDNFVSKSENPDSNDENTAAMALGAMNYGFTNLELTGAYAAIANKGVYKEPMSFSKIVDRNGRVILEEPGDENKVFDEDVAFLIQDAMRTTTNRGVAQNAKVPGFDVAGKTGTSGTADIDQDSWYIGYTPYYTVGVWMGSDDQQLKISSISGITTSIFREINKYILEDKEEKEFEIPSNIIEVEVCNQSGKLPSFACYDDSRGTIITEYFIKGTEPKDECTVHQYITINSSDGLLATSDTPERHKVDKLFITRDKEFNPDYFNGLTPTDWYLMPPTKYSTEKGLLDSIIDTILGDDNETETEKTETETETEKTETEAPSPPPQQTETETEAPKPEPQPTPNPQPVPEPNQP